MNQKYDGVLKRFRKAVRAGKIYPCGTQEGFCFRIGDAFIVEEVLHKLWPYLSKIKKDQAKKIVSRFNRRP